MPSPSKGMDHASLLPERDEGEREKPFEKYAWDSFICVY